MRWWEASATVVPLFRDLDAKNHMSYFSCSRVGQKGQLELCEHDGADQSERRRLTHAFGTIRNRLSAMTYRFCSIICGTRD